jgi:membrane associated rhomboid family serine protease
MRAGNWNPALSQQQVNALERYSSTRESEDKQYTPFLSVAMVVAHFVTLIMVMQQNDCPNHTTKSCLFPSLHRFSFQPFSENPLLGPSAKTLLTMGALESDLITKARDGWRLLSAIWLHAGVLQIIGNDLGMLLLGIPLERHMGFIKVLAYHNPAPNSS